MRSMIYFVTVLIISAAMFTAACTKPKPKEDPAKTPEGSTAITQQTDNTVTPPVKPAMPPSFPAVGAFQPSPESAGFCAK